MEFFNSR